MKIVHLEDKHRFLALIEGHECVLDYRVSSDPKVLEYYHTYVAPELRGRQIAEKITTVAMDYARANGFKVIPACPYVKRFVEMHPEYADVTE
jgi:predicted GNAT family acetyltransferase